MNSRIFSSTMKEYITKYRTKTKENRIKFMNYLRLQRQQIIERERQRLVKRIIFWSVITISGYLIYNQIYRKKVEISKMSSKLDNFYSAITIKQKLKEDVSCLTVTPKTLDQIANIISLAYRYHFKVIVRMHAITRRQKIILSEKFDNKCLFVDLSCLNSFEIDAVNNTIYAQSGLKCETINKQLEKRGFEPLFCKQLQSQSIYEIITSNLPLLNGELNKYLISMQLLSASGQNFRSAGQTNQYGQIPSLNSLFIGTGGIFAIPTASTIKINKKTDQQVNHQRLSMEINDVNERVLNLRKLSNFTNQSVELEISNRVQNSDKSKVIISCLQKNLRQKKEKGACSQYFEANFIPKSNLQQSVQNLKYNVFFSVNQRIFEEFYLSYQQQLPFSYKNGLLKVMIPETPNHQKHIQVINKITNRNGVLVWCEISEILNRIKPSLDSQQVGAELMRKIVQVRQGLDPRNILYSHSRYEDYFAKGLFRKLTEYFW